MKIIILKVIILGFKKPIVIPKIKCKIFLEQLYYMYFNTESKNAQKGGTIIYFHPQP